MSYSDAEPIDPRFYVFSEELYFAYTCPRCGSRQRVRVGWDALLHGFECTCYDPRCAAPHERPGFRLMYDAHFDGSILGLLDRPLHEHEEVDR